MVNLQDNINKLYMAANGQDIDGLISSSSVSDYVDYINEIYDKSDVQVTEHTVDLNEGFFAKFRANVKKQAAEVKLPIKEVLALLEKIKNQDKNLTEKEFGFIGGASNSLASFLAKLNLPKIEQVDMRSSEYQVLNKEFKKDKMFSSQHKILACYKPYTEQRTFNKEWTKKTVVHGTSNLSLALILGSHFKTISQLRKEGNVIKYAGSMLGDGIYFALPEQISKTSWYMDKEQKTKYIFVCDIYYKDEKVTKSPISSFKYNGSNMQHLLSYGAYSRDELVVLPSQINIKYILEVK